MFKKILVILIIVIFTLSCTDNEYGIFYYLENEEEEIDDTLNNELTITHVDIYTPSGSIYVAAGTSAYIKTGSWHRLNMPSGKDYCSALVISNISGSDLLYGGFYNELWSTANFDTGSPAWSEITDPDINGKQIIKLKEVNGNIVVVTFNGSIFDVYYSSTGAINSFESTGILGLGTPVLDIIYDNYNNDYWAITKDNIYKSLSGINDLTIYTHNISTSDDFTGIYYSSNYNNPVGKFYVATNNGKVYESTDGFVNAVNLKLKDGISVSGNNVPFTLISEINGNILVGTYGYGYYEMTNGDVNSIVRLSDFTSSDLYDGWVTGFKVNVNTCYFLTGGSGLWFNTYASGEWGSDWQRE